ncbi:MAG: GIY-YIG nuclease family protein [Pseudomonadota bacterium]
MPTYSVYIVECRDGTFYTGVATDVERRLREHESGARGARYLRGRGPLRVVFKSEVGDRSYAQRAEYRIKRLAREQKQALIDGRLQLATLLLDQEPLAAEA